MEKQYTVEQMETQLEELGFHTAIPCKIELMSLYLGDEFIKAIKNAQEGHAEGLEYLELVFKSVSDYTLNELRTNGLPHSFGEILSIQLTDKRLFLKAVKALSNDETRLSALAFLREKLSSVVARHPKVCNDVDHADSEIEYYSHHVYGTKFALCFSAGVAADQKSKVVNVDGAPATAARKYDWTRKIAIQLKMEELYKLLAVLQLKLDFARFSNHGPLRDKHFTVTAQRARGTFLATLSQRSKENMAVEIPATTAISIASMVLRQVFDAHPHLDRETLFQLLATMMSPECVVDAKNG